MKTTRELFSQLLQSDETNVYWLGRRTCARAYNILQPTYSRGFCAALDSQPNRSLTCGCLRDLIERGKEQIWYYHLGTRTSDSSRCFDREI